MFWSLNTLFSYQNRLNFSCTRIADFVLNLRRLAPLPVGFDALALAGLSWFTERLRTFCPSTFLYFCLWNIFLRLAPLPVGFDALALDCSGLCWSSSTGTLCSTTGLNVPSSVRSLVAAASLRFRLVFDATALALRSGCLETVGEHSVPALFFFCFSAHSPYVNARCFRGLNR